MGTRADFYISMKKPKWIGSLYKDGDPLHIPAEILIEINKIGYEEKVVDFLTLKNGVIESVGDSWPWPWEDSLLTDYSYFFSKKYKGVYAYSMVEKIMFYPLRILQGDDLIGSSIQNHAPKFPLLGVGYGPNIAKSI